MQKRLRGNVRGKRIAGFSSSVCTEGRPISEGIAGGKREVLCIVDRDENMPGCGDWCGDGERQKRIDWVSPRTRASLWSVYCQLRRRFICTAIASICTVSWGMWRYVGSRRAQPRRLLSASMSRPFMSSDCIYRLSGFGIDLLYMRKENRRGCICRKHRMKAQGIYAAILKANAAGMFKTSMGA